MPDNASLLKKAKTVIAGGVNSPVRAFKSVGGVPVFIDRARGPYIYDSQGKQYIDYVGSWGPMVLGHNDEQVVKAILQQCEKGLSFGAPTEIETELAETVCRQLPWIEQVRMVNSGTEATMSAVRLARGYTGRDKLIKFEGCYHGHGDSMLVKAGSGALTMGIPTSAGVPAAIAGETLIAQFNDSDSVKNLLQQFGDKVAAIILEPVAGNMNCVLPITGFLSDLRNLCDEYEVMLIMDEVMTGFRVGEQGAQGLYGVKGDITVLGKIIGGGMPVGAFGGKKEIMSHLAPEGGVYQAGTLSGNPVAMAAGLATLKSIQTPGFYQQLSDKTESLVTGIKSVADELNVALHITHVGGMFGLFFTDQDAIISFSDVMSCDRLRFNTFFHAMLNQGVYLAPSAFEAGFVSIAHGETEIDRTIDVARQCLTSLIAQ